MLNLSKYKACICEGSAEKAIMNILFENEKVIFKKEELLEQEIISCRSGKEFENRYLRKDFDNKISVIRILDSRKEVFKLSAAYKAKVDVINIITAPEIEMLIILNENKYEDFKKSKKKPSEYCKSILRLHNVKNYDFVQRYFSDVDILIAAIKKYKKMMHIPQSELTLGDILIE